MLRKLSLLQVFGAIRQAVQKAPHYPETHNLHGLVCEARSEYQAAITSFRLARCAIISSGDTSKSCLQDIAVNLARSLSKVNLYFCLFFWTFYRPVKVFTSYSKFFCFVHGVSKFWGFIFFLFFSKSLYLVQAGYAADAVQECESLRKEGSVLVNIYVPVFILFYFA